VAAFIWSINRVGLSFSGIAEIIEGWPATRNLLGRMVPPFIPSEDLDIVISAAFDTFFMAFAGTALGLVLGIPLGLLSARNVMPWAPVRGLARAVIVFSRAIPALVFAIFFVRIYGIGVLPGVISIGIHSIGMIGKLIADAAEDIDPGPREGVASTGAGPMQDLFAGVWNQMVPTVITISLYRLELDFRSAPILGWVGAGGIGVLLRTYQGTLRYQEMLGVTLLIVILVIILEALSALTRHALLGTTERHPNRAKDPKSKRLPNGLTSPGTKIADWLISRSNQRATLAKELPQKRLTPPWTVERVKVTAVGFIFSVLLVLSLIIPDIGADEVITGSERIPEMLRRLTPNDWSWFTDRIVSDMIDTLGIGMAATGLALLFAIPFSFLAASNTAPGRFVYLCSRSFMLLVRCAPELVVAVIFVAAIGPGPRAGTLALAIALFGFITKLFADAIEEARQGIRDGVASTGSNRLQESTTAVLPQVITSKISNSMYLLDVGIRNSAIVGIVGGGGIGFLVINASRQLEWETLGGIIFCIFVVVYTIELLATWVRRKVT
jgi:phosphonate transport system permease protein